MPGDLTTPHCCSGCGGQACLSAGRGTWGWRVYHVCSDQEGKEVEEPGGTETGLMRRPGTRSLGVGEENGSDWKGKLQEGSGGTR